MCYYVTYRQKDCVNIYSYLSQCYVVNKTSFIRSNFKAVFKITTSKSPNGNTICMYLLCPKILFEKTDFFSIIKMYPQVANIFEYREILCKDVYGVCVCVLCAYIYHTNISARQK